MEWSHFNDIDLYRDSFDDFHAVGCDNDNEVLQYNLATSTSLHIGAMSGENRFTFIGWVNDFSATRCAMFERDGETLILSNRDGDFSARSFDTSSAELILIDPVDDDLPTPDIRLMEADILDILVPVARAPDGVDIFIVVDGEANAILIVDPDFQVIQEIALDGSPSTVDAIFGPDGTLYILWVSDDGMGTIMWGTHDDGMVDQVVLGLDLLTTAAMWIDGTSNNILQVVAAVEDVTTDEDPLFYGVAYLRDGDDGADDGADDGGADDGTDDGTDDGGDDGTDDGADDGTDDGADDGTDSDGSDDPGLD
jgi:hypothetical protein